MRQFPVPSCGLFRHGVVPAVVAVSLCLQALFAGLPLAGAEIIPDNPACNQCDKVGAHALWASTDGRGITTVVGTLSYAAFCERAECSWGDTYWGCILPPELSGTGAFYGWTEDSGSCSPACDYGALSCAQRFVGLLPSGLYRVRFDASMHTPPVTDCTTLCEWSEYFTVPECAMVDADLDGWTVCAGGDCDDADPLVHPGMTETCNGVDDDCDGLVDEDHDGDGYTSCQGDCDDSRADTYPGAAEVCDGRDNDCVGGVPANETDDDGDGYSECSMPSDCDDTRNDVYPGAAERCDLADNDCDPGTGDPACCEPEQGTGPPSCLLGEGSINAGNGNVYVAREEFVVRGAALGLPFRRVYNSRSTRESPLGYGWGHNYDMSLGTTACGDLRVTDADGRSRVYRETSPGSYASTGGDPSRVAANVDGTYTFQEGDRKRRFSAEGRLEKVEDFFGNEIRLTYAGGLLTAIEEYPKGLAAPSRTLVLEYDGVGKLSQVRPAPGATPVVSYGHDAGGNLTGARYADGTSLDYFYEDLGDVHNLSRVTDGAGRLVKAFDYDVTGDRAVAGYAGGNLGFVGLSYVDGRTTRVTTSGGVKTVVHQQINGVPVGLSVTGIGCDCAREESWDEVGFRKTASRDGRGVLTSYGEFDPLGNPTLVIRAAGTAEEQVWRYTYNQVLDKPSSMTDPLGTVTTYVYSGRGELERREVAPPGLPADILESRTFDAANFGRPVSDLLNSYFYHPVVAGDPKSGLLWQVLGSASGSVPNVTSTVYESYDLFGNPTRVTGPDGVTYVMEYDAVGRPRSRTNLATAASVTYTYDALGFLDTVAMPEGRRLDYDHDVLGNLLSVTDALGNRIEYSYDDRGNRIAEERFDGAGVSRYRRTFEYDGEDRLWKAHHVDGTWEEYEYDAAGNVVRRWDGARVLTEYAYDTMNRVLTVTRAGVAIARYGYDTLGRVVSVKDGEGRETVQTYDVYGFPGSVVSPDTGTTAFTAYQRGGPQHGELIEKLDASGTTVRTTTRLLNGVSAPAVLEGRDGYGNVLSYVYEYRVTSYPLGALEWYGYPGQTPYGVSFAYDAAGRVSSKAFKADGRTYQTSFTYTGNGEVAAVTYPSGRVVGYERDAVGNVTRVWGSMGGVETTYADGVTWYPFGGLRGFTRGNGVVEEVGLDQEYRVASVSSGSLFRRTYGYTPSGDVGTVADGVSPERSQGFTYDGQGRLASAVGSYGTLEWLYDGGGNREVEKRDGWSTYYWYESGTSRLRWLSGREAASFSYDGRGNVTGDGVHTYGYDQFSRRTWGDGAYQYFYLPTGERVARRKVADGSLRHFHYDLGGHLIGESLGDGTWVVEYVWLGERLLARVENGLARGLEEGYRLSRRSDWQTSEVTYTQADDLWVKVWSTEVNPRLLSGATATLRSVANGKVFKTVSLASQGDGSYVGVFDLAGLSLSRGGNVWTWSASVTDTGGVSYTPAATVYVYAATGGLFDLPREVWLAYGVEEPKWGGVGEEAPASCCTGGWNTEATPWKGSGEDRSRPGEGAEPLSLEGYTQIASLEEVPLLLLAAKPVAGPTVSSCSPASGGIAGGTYVTVLGSNFVSGAQVSFGGVAATGEVWVSSTSLRCYTPAHAAGAVTITVTNPDGKSGSKAGAYTYVGTTNPAPVVVGVSPSSGDVTGGTPVTVGGSYFQAGATVTFGGVGATGVEYVSSTSLRCYTPAHAVGAVTVTVTNPDGLSGSTEGGFTYEAGYEVVYYYHVDHLGTPQVLSNAAGQTVWEGVYEPFGVVTTVSTGMPVNENVRFPGQYYDAESGLHQNRWRDYDPRVGRYLEADPAGIVNGTNHLYGYAAGNPINGVDPLGLLAITAAYRPDINKVCRWQYKIEFTSKGDVANTIAGAIVKLYSLYGSPSAAWALYRTGGVMSQLKKLGSLGETVLADEAILEKLAGMGLRESSYEEGGFYLYDSDVKIQMLKTANAQVAPIPYDIDNMINQARTHYIKSGWRWDLIGRCSCPLER